MLIAMFILLVPAIIHEVPITLPATGEARPLTTHRLAVARDARVMLDGVAVSDAGLAARSRGTSRRR